MSVTQSPPSPEAKRLPIRASGGEQPSRSNFWDRLHTQSFQALGLRQMVWVMPLLVFLVALVPRLLGLDTFLTADEDDQLNFAARFLMTALAGDWKQALVLGYPGVPTMALGALALGVRYLLHSSGFSPLPYALAGEPIPDLSTMLTQAQFYPLTFVPVLRVAMVVVASLAVLGIYLFMRRIVGQGVAFVAALFIAFDPFFLANTRIVHVDAPMAYFMFISFLSFWLYLTEARWGWLALSGVMGGLATLSKTPGALLGPILILAGLVYALNPEMPGAGQTTGAEQGKPAIPAGRRWRRFGIAVIVWGVVAVGAFFAMWPSMWIDPGMVIERLVSNALIAANTVHPSSGVFWGPSGSDQNPLYYLISLPFHLTPLTTIGLLVGIVATWRCRRHRALLLALWLYAILFIAVVSMVGRRGDRYILPVYLALDFLAALALCWLAYWKLPPAFELPGIRFTLGDSRGQGEPSATDVPVGENDSEVACLNGAPFTRKRTWLLAAVIVAQVAFVLLFHPYYFPYLNPLVGGPRTGPYLINLGWGEGLDQAAAYLNQIPGIEDKKVAAWYSWQFAPYFNGHTIDLASNEPALTADYSVLYINQIQRGLPSQELVDYFLQRRPLYTVRLGGVDYAYVYEGPVIGSESPSEVPYAADLTLGGAVHLIGYDVSRPDNAADTDIGVTLFWEILAPVHEDYNVYVRAVNKDGNVWGQVDRLPIGGLWRTNQWRPGAVVRDEYRLSLLPGVPPDYYRLDVSMYSYETGETFGVGRNVGWIEVGPAHNPPSPNNLTMQHTMRKTVAPGLELMGYDLPEEKIGPGQRLPVTLYWRNTRPLDTDYALIFDAKSVAGDEGGSWPEFIGTKAYPTSQWRWREIIVNQYQLQMPASARSGYYVLNVRPVVWESGETVSREILGKLEFVERERNFETPDVQYQVGANLGDVVHLIGYDLSQETVAAGQSFPLTLHWRALRETNRSYTVFVHVVGPDGVIRGQWDSVPGAGTLPTSGWLEGEVVSDNYLVPMAEDAPPWRYTIIVGMYDTETGVRLDEVGGYERDHIPLGSIQVAPSP